MAPDKGSVLFAVFRERIISSDPGVCTFERSDLECYIAGDDSIRFPLLDDADIEFFCTGIVIPPQLNRIFGDFVSCCVGLKCFTSVK